MNYRFKKHFSIVRISGSISLITPAKYGKHCKADTNDFIDLLPKHVWNY